MLAARALALAAAYFVAGKLALALAIPPGYATAVFPPAGLALAGTLLMGPAALPAVFLGSFLLNVGVSLEQGASLLVPAGIGLGAVLQAAAGAALVRRFLGYPLRLLDSREVLWFLALGAAGCLVAASWGTAVLGLAGLLPASEAAFSWFNWYVGDTIGVLLFTPVGLLWGSGERRRAATVTLPLVLLLGLEVVAFVRFSQLEQARLETEFRKRAGAVVEAFRDRFTLSLDVLYSLRSFFESSNEVTRDEFKRYVAPLLARNPDVDGLSWNLVVPEEERQDYEAEARREGFPDFRMTEPGRNGAPVEAARRARYVSVLFIEPLGANRPALGLDVSADPLRNEALRMAEASLEAAATRPIRLVQDESGGFGCLIFLPVRDPESGAVRGFVTGVYRFQTMLTASLTPAMVDGLETRLLGNAQLLHTFGDVSSPPDAEALTHTVSFELAGRHWALEVRATPEYMRQQRSWQAWTILAVALLLVALLGAFMLVLTGRTAIVESEVAERTLELRRSNEELRIAKNAAEAANRTKDEFLANVSHELRTPLNGVMGMTELLGETAMDAEQREGLMVVRRCSESLLRIINDILDFSKMEEGRLTLISEAFDLEPILSDLLAMGRSRAADRRLEVRLDLADDVPRRLVGDGGRLRQVLGNLVDNALKFTERGEIALGVVVESREAGMVDLRFTVSDTGIGIHPDDRGKLFQKFQQVDSSSTRRYGGTGLGLVISRRLVQLMGGDIEVESAPGEGTTFRFVVPLDVVEAVTGPAPSPSREPGERSLRRILIAEDNEINLHLMRSQLALLGPHEVAEARNGVEVVEAVSRVDYDLILMDCQMPQMDGFEATRAVREVDAAKGRHTVVVGVTAHAVAGYRDRCLAAGMDDYLSKPARVADLQGMLDKWL